ncbi:hypothetical protein ABZ816_12855 [Actinosynnema sp. NPDC047251]|uniref:Putative membrane protein n=1 Tax=Saccharothrix espanaensis (strain ATCC 51144 / DSM 44229 / JCM 9112 / NBRC 15066 / NRRL 15764) TaxID=1179773 RepID=K0KB63_SACES|nr:hypothetical protein [Saccharothrix espanaensis]CCH35486.1 putative membrane protein [Saccharothrix espanaensis DSM 44229]
MDERKIAELFRDATNGAPPASFDVGNVRSASARATARRRTRLALGSAMVVVLAFGGVVAYANLVPRENVSTSAGSAEDHTSPNLSPFAVPEPRSGDTAAVPEMSGGMPPKSIPDDPSTQGDGTSGTTGRPTTGGASGCQEVDRELAVALADELPAAEGLQPSHAVANCPTGARGAGYLVRDEQGVYGVVSVVLVPPGVQTLASSSPSEGRAPARGGTVFVLSEPAQGSAVGPFEGVLTDLASRVAGRL